MEFLNQMIESIEKNLSSAKFQLKIIESGSSLQRCNTICMFKSGLTIEANEHGKPVVNNGVVAMQFEPKTAKNICETVKNGNGEHPTMKTPKEYYSFIVNQLEENLKFLQDAKK